MATLHTVHDDGTVTTEEITSEIFSTPRGKALVSQWAAEQDAWEDLCYGLRQRGISAEEHARMPITEEPSPRRDA